VVKSNPFLTSVVKEGAFGVKLISGVKRDCIPLTGNMGAPQPLAGHFGEEKICYSFWESKEDAIVAHPITYTQY
jgi:hypothetical protein